MTQEAKSTARNTTVLIVGATGQVGKIVLRKLLLRGYRVKALVRGDPEEPVEKIYERTGIPELVDVIPLDFVKYSQKSDGFTDKRRWLQLKKAVQGVDKLIYCATTKSEDVLERRQLDQYAIRDLCKFMKAEQSRQIIEGSFISSRTMSHNLMMVDRWETKLVRDCWYMEGEVVGR